MFHFFRIFPHSLLPGTLANKDTTFTSLYEPYSRHTWWECLLQDFHLFLFTIQFSTATFHVFFLSKILILLMMLMMMFPLHHHPWYTHPRYRHILFTRKSRFATLRLSIHMSHGYHAFADAWILFCCSIRVYGRMFSPPCSFSLIHIPCYNIIWKFSFIFNVP